MKILKVLIASLLLALSALISGCAGEKDNTTTQRRYAEDGYMGMSTANPGIPTSPGARTSYSNDLRNVDLALQDLSGIRRKMVRIGGDTLHVHIKAVNELTTDELQVLRGEAVERLAAMFPRYKVRVRVSQ